MDPFSTASPILLVPSWGTALPVMSISLLAADFYNISLWATPNGQACTDTQRNGGLRPIKWNWHWIESSYWMRWRFSHPGTYCVQVTPFRCAYCPTTMSGPFVVNWDTSEQMSCCFTNRTRLSLTQVFKHRIDPDRRKTVGLRVNLRFDVNNSSNHPCATRFFIEFFNSACRWNAVFHRAAPLFADELLPDTEYRLHNVPLNSTHLCAKLTPRCDRCVFLCPSTYHLIDLRNQTLVSPEPFVEREPSGWAITRHSHMAALCVLLWLIMTCLTSAIVLTYTRGSFPKPGVNVLALRRRNAPRTLASRYTVVPMAHIE